MPDVDSVRITGGHQRAVGLVSLRYVGEGHGANGVSGRVGDALLIFFPTCAPKSHLWAWQGVGAGVADVSLLFLAACAGSLQFAGGRTSLSEQLQVILKTLLHKD